MQTFAEFVAESFHSEVSLNWDLARINLVTATFAVDEIKVVVTFEQRKDSPAWYVVFEVEQSDSTATATVHSSFEILDGVLQAVTEFVGVRQPELLVFATKKDKLANIYRTYLRRESATLETLGYQLEGPQRVDPYMQFTLRRIKAPEWKE
jgi:hypothetical protein